MISCSYNNCSNEKTTHSDIGFFKFPVYDLELLQTWLTKCGNSNLFYCSVDELKTKYVCEKHFSPDVILLKLKENGRFVKVLKKYFAPVQCQDEEKPDPLQVTNEDEDGSNDVQIIIDDEENDDGDTECIIITVDDGESDKEVNIEDLESCSNIEIKKEILDIEEPMVQGELDTEDNKDGVIEEGSTLNILCYVPNCKVRAGKSMEDTFYFKPPLDDENMFKIWDICIGHKERRLTKEDRVCQEHFNEEDLIKRIKVIRNDKQVFAPVKEICLKTGAVPCIYFKKECCVPDCNNITGRMYCFPVLRDSEFHLWLYLIKNPKLKNLNMRDILQYRVCENHFEFDCFDKNFKLTHSAAPTVCVPEVYPALLEEPSPSVAPRQYSQLLVGKCIYKGCTNVRNHNYLFKFPSEPDRCVRWLHACGRSELITTPKETALIMNSRKLGICQDHFDINEFTTNISKLKPTAVPKFYSSKHIKAEPKVNPAEGTSVAFPSNSRQILDNKVVKIPGIQGKVLSNLSEDQSSSTARAKKLIGRFCIYKSCPNRVTPANSFPFPSQMMRAEKWLQACGSGNNSHSNKIYIVRNSRVCRNHFEKHMFNGLDLRHNAVPIPIANNEEKIAEKNINLVESNIGLTEPQNSTTDQPQNATADQAQNVTESGDIPTSETGKDAEQSINDKNGIYSRKIKKCAALLCSTSLYPPEIFHSFPDPNKDKERFCIWMQLLLGSGSKNIPHQTLFEDYAVCNKHFQNRMFKKGTTELLPVAVPMMHLATTYSWFYQTGYYKNKIKPLCNNSEEQDDSENVEPSAEIDPTNYTTLKNAKRCVLEEDRIDFPDLGTHLYTGRGETSQSGIKRPYGVYRYFNNKYGLDSDLQFGENIMIHTAIIIEDDDMCEKRVIRQLLEDNIE